MTVASLTVAEARQQLAEARLILAVARTHLEDTPSGALSVRGPYSPAWMDAMRAEMIADADVTAAEHRLDAVRSQQRDCTLGDYEPERRIG